MRPCLRLMFAVALISVGALGSAPRAQNYHALDIEAQERAAEVLINESINAEGARFAPGAPHLAADSSLMSIAHQRSHDMAHGAPFAHEDSEGHFAVADKVRA